MSGMPQRQIFTATVTVSVLGDGTYHIEITNPQAEQWEIGPAVPPGQHRASDLAGALLDEFTAATGMPSPQDED